ncbi:9384_t:CDS:2 [Cetraspora pellucida]|uniref:9384_t:CDS:1 n=1 Tax=Cetraspora pellucida TaxID=1433469 RepID=A0A9N9BS44_9GLOM|nr:9384_t:CDS:2 [Cetraspora pellucida]
MIDSDSNDDNDKNNSNKSKEHKLPIKLRRANSVDSITPQAARPISSVKTSFDTKIIQDLLVSSALNVANSTKMPSDPIHPPLNIKLLGDNFRKFVQKCGFIFVIQDFAEDIFLWKNPPDTLLTMVIYVYICLYPQLLILAPLVAFLAVLIYNFPNESQTKKKARIKFKRFERLNDYLPAENSVDYLKNMQNIQNLMGLISDGYDVAVDLLKHVDWSNECETLMIMQVVMVVLVVTSLTVWIVPWKYVFIFCGLGMFIVNTQFVKALTKEMSPIIIQHFKTFVEKWEDYFSSEDCEKTENSGYEGETDSSIENNWINLNNDEVDPGVGSSKS